MVGDNRGVHSLGKSPQGPLGLFFYMCGSATVKGVDMVHPWQFSSQLVNQVQRGFETVLRKLVCLKVHLKCLKIVGSILEENLPRV